MATKRAMGTAASTMVRNVRQGLSLLNDRPQARQLCWYTVPEGKIPFSRYRVASTQTTAFWLQWAHWRTDSTRESPMAHLVRVRTSGGWTTSPSAYSTPTTIAHRAELCPGRKETRARYFVGSTYRH